MATSEREVEAGRAKGAVGIAVIGVSVLKYYTVNLALDLSICSLHFSSCCLLPYYVPILLRTFVEVQLPRS